MSVKYTKTNKLKQIFGNLSIRYKFAILMITVVFFTVSVIGLTSYRVSENIMEKSSIKSTLTLIELASNILKMNLLKIEEISADILSDFDLQSLVRGDVTNEQRLKLRSKIFNIMSVVISSNNLIDSIALYTFSNSSYLYSTWIEKESEQKDFRKFIHDNPINKIISLNGKTEWISINSNNNDIVSLIRVVNINESQNKTGVLCINVKGSIYKSVSETLNISSKSALFLKDKNSTLIFSQYNNKNLLKYSSINKKDLNDHFVNIQGSNYYRISVRFPLPDWNVEVYIPSAEIFASGRIIKASILITVIISFIIIALMVILLSDYITRPILKLRKIMLEVEKGDLSKKMDVRYTDEIGYLGKSFNSMIQQIKEYIEEIYNNYQRVRESELDALQMKINPHFLYNNLNTINWMAQDIKAENIEILSRALTNYFRLSLSKGSNIITIQEELEQLKNYIIIQNMRYKDCIDIKLDIDERISGYRIVKLTLQPLVENAIFHGIEGKNGYGEILISGKLINEHILFEVKDNGIGMTEEQLKEIRESLIKQKSVGYGMRNVNERIKLYFGEYYGLEIMSEYKKGTVVRVNIPVREESDYSNEGVNS